MNEEILKRLKEIEVEDFVLGIFIFIIIFSYIANQIEKDYFITGSEKSRSKYYYLQIFIFTVIFIINVYYVIVSYQDYRNLNENDSYKKVKYTKLDLVVSISALVATSIILYIAITDISIEAEITL